MAPGFSPTNKNNLVTGRFEPVPAPLCSKMRSFRLTREGDVAFMAAAADFGLPPGVLARHIIEEWLESQKKAPVASEGG
ncbi:hypothetical protein [Microseira wollei]|uniref:Uncharacterized protein n=1 Tax=Microseira wollei NIES-4236 TaxID=2530354 RepID=A0AAV3XCF2_9CYAN|nr:hypothetical protein [Microseira wollei]GET38475.1 hypothetical protein MiSe_32330 [Microseira wollei NIES-4236]